MHAALAEAPASGAQDAATNHRQAARPRARAPLPGTSCRSIGARRRCSESMRAAPAQPRPPGGGARLGEAPGQGGRKGGRRGAGGRQGAEAGRGGRGGAPARARGARRGRGRVAVRVLEAHAHAAAQVVRRQRQVLRAGRGRVQRSGQCPGSHARHVDQCPELQARSSPVQLPGLGRHLYFTARAGCR